MRNPSQPVRADRALERVDRTQTVLSVFSDTLAAAKGSGATTDRAWMKQTLLRKARNYRITLTLSEESALLRALKSRLH